MSVYTSCADECVHKDLARKLVKDINDAGILCFYSGDIPNEIRIDLMDAIAAANERSEIFMPFLSRESEGSRLGRNELAYANSLEKVIMPVLLDPDYGGVKTGGLLTGIKITDISTPSKYEKEVPELIRAIRTMIPVLEANVRSGRATGSAPREGEDRETESEGGDEDPSDGWSAADDDQEDSETEMAEDDQDA